MLPVLPTAQRAPAARLPHTPAARATAHCCARRTPRQCSRLPSPHAHAHRSQACRASPCTGQGCSYVLRQRPREGAPCHRSRPPASHRLASSYYLCAAAVLHPHGPASRDTRTRSSPRPRPCPHRVNRGIIPHCSRICPPSSRHAHCVYRLLCLLVGTIVNLCRPLRRARSGARAPNRTRAPRDTSCLQPVPVHTASPARASLARLLHGPFQHAQPSPAPPLAGACRRSSSRVGRPLRRRPARRRSARRRRLLQRAPSFPGALTLPAGRGRPCAPPPSLS